MSKSTLSLRSNLMVDDDAHTPKQEYLPGDFLRLVRPWMFDRRIRDEVLSPQQIVEYEQYLRCHVCGRTCAGTCSD